MALASITTVRQGLATRADTIAGLSAIAYIPERIAPPTFVVGVVSQDFDQAMGRGLDSLLVTCHLYVSRSTDKVGQGALDAYLAGSGAKSIKTVIEADKTLAGACSALRVESQQGYGIYDVAGTEYLGATFTVKVWG